MLEKHLERKVVAHCKANDILCYKFVSPAHRGVPDRLMIKNGKVLFLELKAPGNVPTALQKHEIQKLRDAGMKVGWTDNVDDATEAIDYHLGGDAA
jgi:hypothetical protein